MTYRPDVVRVASDDAAVSERVRAVSVPAKIEVFMGMPEPERLHWKARNEGLYRQIEVRRDDASPSPSPFPPTRAPAAFRWERARLSSS